jgi:hypothetical protein
MGQCRQEVICGWYFWMKGCRCTPWSMERPPRGRPRCRSTPTGGGSSAMLHRYCSIPNLAAQKLTTLLPLTSPLTCGLNMQIGTSRYCGGITHLGCRSMISNSYEIVQVRFRQLLVFQMFLFPPPFLGLFGCSAILTIALHLRTTSNCFLQFASLCSSHRAFSVFPPSMVAPCILPLCSFYFGVWELVLHFFHMLITTDGLHRGAINS